MKQQKTFREEGIPSSRLMDRLRTVKSSDAPWKAGKVFGYLYHPGNDHTRISEEYYRAFYYENTNNPTTFPSLKNFERDIVRMAAELMHGGRQVSGNVTTGGTESIFLAVKVARDLAREKDPDRFREAGNTPEALLPVTVHPAFLKACHYLQVRPVTVAVREDKTTDPQEMEKAITANTVLIACSAPCFPYGVIDPVREIAGIARRRNLPFHVDSCMGGFMLPFLEELGYPVPEFDFRVPGVTSISLDVHKYGYAPKGSSVILYRHRSFRRKQFFIDTEWPGGIFASTTFMGTKCGGPLAGAWAIMNHLGKEGYRRLAAEVMQCTVRIREGIESIEGLKIIGRPDMTIMAFTSEKGDIYEIGDALSLKGWHLDRLQFPEALHLTVNKLNVGMENEFLDDLRQIVEEQVELRSRSRATRASLRLVGGLAGILPAGVFEGLARMAGKLMGGEPQDSGREGTGRDGAGREGHTTAGGSRKKSRGGSQAALYGIHASFNNRGNVKKLVENLLDGIYS
jgi:sphinganine-1-phosphate aldolase